MGKKGTVIAIIVIISCFILFLSVKLLSLALSPGITVTTAYSAAQEEIMAPGPGSHGSLFADFFGKSSQHIGSGG